MWVVTAYTAERARKVGTRWYRDVTSRTRVKARPAPTPISDDAVNYDTALPWISATLFAFANLTLILALDADDSIKHTFLPTLAIEAIRRKCYGAARVMISIQNAMFKTAIDKNLHFFISASKLEPNLAANRIAPSCPAPSLRTHWTAADAIFACVVVLNNKNVIIKKIELTLLTPQTNSTYSEIP